VSTVVTRAIDAGEMLYLEVAKEENVSGVTARMDLTHQKIVLVLVL
jgi:hypothetical protein